MSNAGTIILTVIILRFLFTWREQKKGGGRSGTADQGTSWRLIFLSLILVLAYVVLAVWLALALAPVLAPIQIDWLRRTLQVAGVALPPLAVFRFVPPWLAWGLRRFSRRFLLSRFCCWFTLGASARELENFAALLHASRGVPPAPKPVTKPGTGEKILQWLRLKRKPRRFAVDAGTVLALALAAEVRGDFGRADRFLHAFEGCPSGMKPTGMLRRFAVAELAWRAAERGDWPSVRQRVRLGSGRAMPLLKMLADARLTGTVNRPQLWLTWSISPSRRRAWPFVLAGAKGGTAVAETPVPSLDGGPRSTHLDLLRHAADGAPVAMAPVFRLARSWDEEFAPCREEALLRRGMALGARDVLGIARRIKQSVLEELEELAAVAEGEIPSELVSSPEGEESSCATELAGRLKNRLYDDVSRAQALFDLAKDAPVADEAILDLWERWLVLREAVARFQSLLGAGELATLWYGGLRETAWNSASRLFNACGGQIAWISIIQFHWVSEIAERFGDEEAMTVNRNNMTVCGYRPPFSARLLLARLSSPFHRLRDRARKIRRRYP